ncbi:MAG: emp24p/erv25p- protein [Cyphobasidiales sp. Tagirdzhanova-0007]|nr:MAG: emp24p/erv25p- protein [Cyphobasidiales sp. Tagirdzhanova-0007]
MLSEDKLPQDTIVVGHYKAEEWNPDDSKWIINDRLGIQITVDETESEERVVNTRGLAEGKFVFTSHVAGDHSICLRSNYTGGWFQTPRVRLHLDIAQVHLITISLQSAQLLIRTLIVAVHSVGEAKVDEESERTHVSDLATKVRDLNKKLEDIRKEQQFQREREHDFRTLSDRANSGAVWWSVLQIVVLLGTCVWQMRTLRTWFIKEKLI